MLKLQHQRSCNEARCRLVATRVKNGETKKRLQAAETPGVFCFQICPPETRSAQNTSSSIVRIEKTKLRLFSRILPYTQIFRRTMHLQRHHPFRRSFAAKS